MAGLRKKLLEGLLHLLYPAVCPSCPKDPEDGPHVTETGNSSRPANLYTAPICDECWSTIKPLAGHLCKICAKPIEADISMCGECFMELPYYRKLYPYGRFDGALREAIHQFKFSNIKRLSRPLSDLLLSMELPEADLIVPVPLTKKRLIERGFNQSLLMAVNLSKRMDTPVSWDTLLKTRETGHQTGKPRKERLQALKNAFVAAKSVEGKRVIVVDDVYTTGATMNECAMTLMEGGATDVYAVVLARAIVR